MCRLRIQQKMMRRISPLKSGIERHNREDTSPNTSTKDEADERRLRKLKGFLKSVSYNGCEGMQFETLNDLYSDSLLLDRPPCTDLLTLGEFKCNPTPFLVSSCFNRTQVNTNTKGKLRGLRKGMRKTAPNRTRKIMALPNKSANTLSEIYGKMEGKTKQVKTPSKKHGIVKGKVGEAFSQGRRSTLDAAVETAIQSGKSESTLVKDLPEDDKKEEKEIKSEHKLQKQETEEKTKVQECLKGKDDVDKTKQQRETEKKSGNNEDSFKTKKEIKDKTKEDKLKQESKKQQHQKPSNKTQPSISGKTGKKGGDREESKSGKQNSNTANIRSVTGKTSFEEARLNSAAKTNSISKTKAEKDFEKSIKCDSTTKPSTSGSHEEEKQLHLEGTKSEVASPVVASTSSDNRSPRTRLRAKPRNDDGRQLRLRRGNPLTCSPKTTDSSDKSSKKENGIRYSIRRRNMKKTNIH